jgi:hypothetical protein
MRTLLLVAVAGCFACSGAEGIDLTSPTDQSSASADQGGDSDAGPAEDFFRCADRDDCVAVRYLAGCCFNGLEIAVNRDEVAEYEKATACEQRRVCPLIIIPDRRVPTCNVQTHLCMMVTPGSEGDAGEGCDQGGER